MPFVPDLDAYFARIGYSGPREPTLAVLRSIQLHHVRTIPFENLAVLLGRPIDLDPAAIERKLVHDRRGGYCFEQNTYLMHVLRTLGFVVSRLGARVRWQVPTEVTTATTHLLLLIELDGQRLLADVGFGSMSLAAPLVLDNEGEQSTPLEPRRIIRRNGFYLQQSLVGGLWSDVYEFWPVEFSAPDIAVANWYTSTHPESRFRLNLTAARVGDGRRYTLLNREFTVRHADGRTEKRELESPFELLSLLADQFGLVFPAGTRFSAPNLAWPSG
ncbi:MAG TPA: arylamine N-acetyltransferase [Candidatus Didemnitutus sp.]|nr:arylamine N-acetyltransferase [Candidatus Didemnitutus sp.]